VGCCTFLDLAGAVRSGVESRLAECVHPESAVNRLRALFDIGQSDVEKSYGSGRSLTDLVDTSCETSSGRCTLFFSAVDGIEAIEPPSRSP